MTYSRLHRYYAAGKEKTRQSAGVREGKTTIRRNLDLMRDIMLEIESREHGDPPVRVINLTPQRLQARSQALNLLSIGEDLDESELARADPEKYYQVQLLYEAGFVKEDPYSASRRGPFTDEFSIEHLTNEGHDFLDSIRDNGIFEAVKDKLGIVGGTASLTVIKSLAETLVKTGLGL